MENIINSPYFEKAVFTVISLAILFLTSLGIKKALDVLYGKVNNRLQNDVVIARTRTIRGLLDSIIDVILFIMVILIILSRWGINIIPLLTGAGLFGLAVSFGAQTLVKDLIAGFFIIMEDQYNIGDKIKVDKYEGIVELVTLRLTVLRDTKNNLIYIPNSQVVSVVKLNTVPKIAHIN